MFGKMAKEDAELLLGLSGSYTFDDIRCAYLDTVEVYSPYMLASGYIHKAAERTVGEMKDARFLLEDYMDEEERDELTCGKWDPNPDNFPTRTELERAYLEYAKERLETPAFKARYGEVPDAKEGDGFEKALFIIQAILIIAMILIILFKLDGTGFIALAIFFVASAVVNVIDMAHQNRKHRVFG